MEPLRSIWKWPGVDCGGVNGIVVRRLFVVLVSLLSSSSSLFVAAAAVRLSLARREMPTTLEMLARWLAGWRCGCRIGLGSRETSPPTWITWTEHTGYGLASDVLGGARDPRGD
uniref:Uncharacterized protein n=1 Tax=Coccidioides posadasii RMSCC 3488 TaxID=454284 RepID=A0A0J6FNS7_COCPO|nr:hypothetical protein CPAG_08341 [Coccidioides posadasii RMSCC 3488]